MILGRCAKCYLVRAKRSNNIHHWLFTVTKCAFKYHDGRQSVMILQKHLKSRKPQLRRRDQHNMLWWSLRHGTKGSLIRAFGLRVVTIVVVVAVVVVVIV